MDQTGSGSEPFRQLHLIDAPSDHCLHLPGTAQHCLGTLEQLVTGITNLGVDATEDPTQAPRVRVLLEELLMSLQQCENDLGIYPPSPFDL
jgi:hypothetical protein